MAASGVVDVRARVRLVSVVEAAGNKCETVRKGYDCELNPPLLEALGRVPRTGRWIPQCSCGGTRADVVADDEDATITQQHGMLLGHGCGHHPGGFPV